jgi:hypothetical protein
MDRKVVCERADQCVIGSSEEPPVEWLPGRMKCQHKVPHYKSVHCCNDVCGLDVLKLRECLEVDDDHK